MSSVPVKEVFSEHSDRLSLSWVAGIDSATSLVCDLKGVVDDEEGGNTVVASESARPKVPTGKCKTIVGPLSLIHPNQIQVVGMPENEYLQQLKPKACTQLINQLYKQSPAAVVFADRIEPPAEFIDRANKEHVPLLRSTMPGDELVGTLSYYLSRLLADHMTLHGVFLEVMGTGVLITGVSGVGKSELALELVSRGHRLIADDAPEFSLAAPDTVRGTCPKGLENFMEVRGLGILNIRALFGDHAVKRTKFLRLIICLKRLQQDELIHMDRLEGSTKMTNLLGVDVPEITLPVAPGRNLAVLVECAARNQILQSKGYVASNHFMDLQRNMISRQ